MSFFVSAVCGYMAGLIGSSNSPLSGIGILVVIGAALLLVLGVKPYVSPDSGKALMAFALFTTAVIFNVAAIANNNLQDLKTGQLVDATPWKQQVALVIGVIAGALVIPPVLDLMNHAYGFMGAPGAELRPNPLPAPQAGLISSLAQGVIAGDIDWSLIRTGGLIGVFIILLDEILARTTRHMRVPPLAVGLGIYLPTQSTLMVVVGAVVGWFFDKQANRSPRPEATKQLGVLLASGLIVGESVILVVISAIVAFSGVAAPLALVGPGFETAGKIIGGVAFVVIAALLYRWIWRLATANAAAARILIARMSHEREEKLELVALDWIPFRAELAFLATHSLRNSQLHAISHGRISCCLLQAEFCSCWVYFVHLANRRFIAAKSSDQF